MKSVLSDAIENAFVDAVNSDKINLFKIKLVVETGRGQFQLLPVSHGVRSAITKYMIRDTTRLV